MIKLKIKRGDNVIVITGKDKGKTGKVIKVFPKDNRAIVSGINFVKKHVKPSQNSAGGIIQRELSIHISNIAHVDPISGEATKVKYRFLEDNTKVRVAKKSDQIISNGTN